MLILKIKLIPMICMILSSAAVLSVTELTAKAQMVSGVYYVTVGGAGARDGSSWANAMSDVQEAIEAAAKYANTQVEECIINTAVQPLLTVFLRTIQRLSVEAGCRIGRAVLS